MDLLLRDKVALITGCDQGIGLSICKKFAENGAIVYANVLMEESVDMLLSLEGNFTGKIVPVCFDITEKNSIMDCIKRIKTEFGRLDIVVNNAGYKKDGLLEMIDDKSMMKMFDVNVFGVVHVTQAALKLMKRNPQGGAIVNIASIVGLRGNIGQSIYGATKGAIASMTKSWSKELSKYGIRVNAVAPGSIDTNMFYEMSEEQIEKTINQIGMKRLGKAEEVANAVMFLASDMASYVTGDVLGVDGGLFM